jgi:hypothetical protein
VIEHPTNLDAVNICALDAEGVSDLLRDAYTAELGVAARTGEEGGQSQHKAIERGQIRDALSGAITNRTLMLEQKRFRGDGVGATRADEFREGDEQVDRQEAQIAHESNVITPATAQWRKELK